MSEDLRPLPLFPLGSVLFPNMLMALHIFEDRYKEMIEDCQDHDSQFGVTLIRSGNEVGDEDVEPYLIGTAASIRDLETVDEGRLNILVQGGSRFRVRDLDRSRSYLVGLVEEVEDDPWGGSDEELGLLERAQVTFRELADALTDRLDFKIQVRLSNDPSALSFAIAGMLGIEQIERQRLLEVTSASERFEEMLPVMRSLISAVQGKQSLREAHYNEIKEWMSLN